jgi:hypothetical protein
MSSSNYTSANLGGIKRGDGDETGDLAARPMATSKPKKPADSDLEGLTVMDADDPDLGLTDIGDIPPDDWAADTGPTRSAEEAGQKDLGR